MGQDQGISAAAPATIVLPAGGVGRAINPGIFWHRIAGKPGPRNYSSDPGLRFSCAEIPGGVLYLGSDHTTCFWEVFWESVQSSGTEMRIGKGKLAERSIFMAKLKRAIRVFDAADPVQLKLIGANGVGCFNGSYAIARSWAARLYEADPHLDGIRFPSARAGSGVNLALFGGRVRAEHVTFERKATLLLKDAEVMNLLMQEKIALVK